MNKPVRVRIDVREKEFSRERRALQVELDHGTPGGLQPSTDTQCRREKQKGVKKNENLYQSQLEKHFYIPASCLKQPPLARFKLNLTKSAKIFPVDATASEIILFEWEDERE